MFTDLAPELCPPVEINYNWAGSTERELYEYEFSSRYTEYIFPFMLQTLRNHQIDPADARLLDIGCGFAPLAYGTVESLVVSSNAFINISSKLTTSTPGVLGFADWLLVVGEKCNPP